MPTLSVVFASTVSFPISATYIGRGPDAEQESRSHGYACKDGTGSGNVILGRANN